MTMGTDMMTVNLLRLCYNCTDAYQCETEEKCLACWTDQGLMTAQDDDGVQETRSYLQMMHD